MKYLLGIDVGTTGTKSLLFNEEGRLLGHAYKGYDLITPQVGWSEQKATDWWDAIVETVNKVVAEAGDGVGENVAGISLSLQGGTLVPVGEDMEPLANARVWNDHRCVKEREAFLQEVGDASVMYKKTGWNLSQGLLALEIRWIKDNDPELFEKTRMFLSVPDFVSYKMTGIAAIDLSDAGINQTGNVQEESYDADLLKFMGIGEDKLPKIVHTGEVIGNLTEKAAKELGLTTDCVLVAGAHDQYAVALGAGATHDGDILIGSGTCWVVTALSNKSNFESGIAQSVSAIPGLWGSCWSLSSGGVCLDWMRKSVTLAKEGELIAYDDINSEVPKRKAAEDGLFFYPFAGYSENRKGFSKGSFIGLDLSHDRYDMMRAVMEGVAFQIKWMMEYFKSKPSETEGLKLAGGATKSAAWSQIVADITGYPVRIPEVADLACVGAAVLAGTGSGVFKDLSEGYNRLAVNEHVLMPDPVMKETYASIFEEYKSKAVLLGNMYGI
ncbi:MAG: FGGY family carbohydrate kinase [Eubacteriales bacterium]|nr:FGGY family carbohydrate kinase [Eubacteriales bacterium]